MDGRVMGEGAGAGPGLGPLLRRAGRTEPTAATTGDCCSLRPEAAHGAFIVRMPFSLILLDLAQKSAAALGLF